MSRLIAEDGSTRDPIERLAEEFLDRYRRGERPGLSEYEQAHPELAEKIRDFFPALVELEGLKQGGELGDPTGSFGDGRSSPRGRSPDRLGDYQILREIGRGGMGIVYEAVRESLKSRVALKVMNPRPNERDRERFALRFKSEARAAAGLHHTNIVGVFDYGEHGGHCYYAMQFIAGHGLDRILDDVRQLRLEEGRKDRGDASQVRESIGEQATIGGSGAWRIGASESALPGASTRRLTEGLLSGQFGRPLDATAPTGLVGGELPTDPPPVPPPSPPGGPVPSGSVDEPSLSSSSLAAKTEVRYFREVARLGAQVADALGHAHRRGVIHRDIKPSNLLLDALGNVWVTDFGLAKLEEGDDLSNSRDIVGTLRYMAPERFRGVSDRRCDTYALGASLYEMLTLRPAFEGSDQIQLIDRIVNEPPKPPRQLDRQIPRDLETIVLKSLAKNPADRFASAEEMAAELTRFVEQRPIKSRSVSPYERLWRWCKRNPGLAAANALAAALTVTLAIVATLSAYKFREQRNDLAAEQRKLSAEQRMTKASLERTERAERKARSALGRSLQSEGATLLRSGYAGQRFESLDWTTPAN
jgi:serine/threonine protein kinase